MNLDKDETYSRSLTSMTQLRNENLDRSSTYMESESLRTEEDP